MVAIQAGDVLLYRGSGLFSRLIRIKTWSEVSHAELANSAASAFASRDGQGVHTYAIDLNPKRLYAILRPRVPLDMAAVRAFHSQCIGQRYDVLGLFRFFTWGQQSHDKQFCSEYVVRLLRRGVHVHSEADVDPFFNHADADLIPPGHLLFSPGLALIWRRPDAG